MIHDVLSLNELLLRLGVATFVGLVLGLDRELRGIPAGMRTHALVSLSAAVTTVSALMLHVELSANDETPTDPLRVIQGLAQAIGFIAAGLIFVSKGNVRNVTSAANIWFATAAGIAAGAGQYVLVGVSSLIALVLVTLVRYVERLLPGHSPGREE